MARLSKKSLSSKQEKELVAQLTSILGKMDKELATYFVLEFLGKEEKVMLAKRLAIIALIHEKRPLHRIATHLHVSETTVTNLKRRYDLDYFHNTVTTLTKNKVDYKKFVDLLESILTVGGIMPMRNTPIRLPR